MHNLKCLFCRKDEYLITYFIANIWNCVRFEIRNSQSNHAQNYYLTIQTNLTNLFIINQIGEVNESLQIEFSKRVDFCQIIIQITILNRIFATKSFSNETSGHAVRIFMTKDNLFLTLYKF